MGRRNCAYCKEKFYYPNHIPKGDRPRYCNICKEFGREPTKSKERVCLRCDQKFVSRSIENRMCWYCKNVRQDDSHWMEEANVQF
ncbi:MAG: hypothetical protein ACO2ZP_04980 [Bacteriovoracaceae bacterium]